MNTIAPHVLLTMTFFLGDAVKAGKKVDPITPGIVYVVEGVGGLDATGQNATSAFKKAGLPHKVERFVWSHGKGRYLADLRDAEHVRAKGEEFAAALVERRSKYPEQPIYIVARSGGTGIVLEALEILPERTVDRAVFLSSAVSPTYDLRKALKAVRGEIVSFHSELDQVILNLGTRKFGTIDRQFTASAGLRGFRIPADLDEEGKQLYQRLVQVPWRPRMIFDGNPGIHKGTSFPGFLAAEVAPWLR